MREQWASRHLTACAPAPVAGSRREYHTSLLWAIFARRPFVLISVFRLHSVTARLCCFATVAVVLTAALRPLPASAQDETTSPASTTPVIDISGTYTADILVNTTGGLARGVRYLDKLLVSANVDGSQAFSWEGASLYASVHYLNGASLTDDLVGDFQVVSNIDTGVQMVRLFEAWAQLPIMGDAASFRVGLYDVNSEFDVTESGGLFVNSSHGIGADIAQSGRNGPSIFPVTSLAARLQLKPAENWTLKLAILDGVPGIPDRPRRFVSAKLGGGDGALFMGEIAYEPKGSKLALGHWRYTAKFENQLPSAGEPIQRRGNAGMYALVEKKLSGAAALGDPGLAAWIRVGVADDRFNPVRMFLGGGLVATAPLADRPHDRAGVAFAWVEFSDKHRTAQALADTLTDLREIKIEATYQAVVTPWLSVQPDIQYIINPGGNPALSDALVVGLRAEIAF
jgi:porin